MSLSVPSPNDITAKNALYITLQFIYEDNGKNKYHWSLFHTANEPPKGNMFHATDTNRKPLDLYTETRPIRDPVLSRSMVVALMVAQPVTWEQVSFCAKSVRLMNPKYLPLGEPRWTCRVWVKEVIKALQKSNYISLPESVKDVDDIERACQLLADLHINFQGDARVFNDPGWLAVSAANQMPGSGAPDRRDVPRSMETDGSRSRYWGPKAMDTDAHGKRDVFGSRPMDIDSPYYGPKPMNTGF
ncbi:hypothetical protein QBC46DRAFT_35571 [Diplogelasinospora grovesii]|uniref:Uncharacterized protein n=1 Tax=Diplogelasinospora grovesii TaxID=303347 RepID=A0AAN6S7S3_9PEZI|nr:hypothetical protein QBC46DRAFT_35571 [Diplogelasinospora grovesii]